MYAFKDELGVFRCNRCARAFEEDPKITMQKDTLEKLRALEDDEQAARAFYYHQANQEQVAKMRKFIVGRFGLNMPAVGTIKTNDIEFLIEPEADQAAFEGMLDQNFLPLLRKDIMDIFEGKDTHAEFKAFAAEERRRQARGELSQVPVLGPYYEYMGMKSIGELYPFGYTRLQDGTIEPNQEPAIKTEEQDPADALAA